MTRESILVAAAYEHPSDAEAAVAELGTDGYGKGDVSLLYTDRGHLAEQGLISGALYGGVIGGLVGLLFPPLGIVVAAGPILGSVASALVTGATVAVAGGALSALVSALLQIGMPKEMADRFGGHVHKGDALVIVHTSSEESAKVKGILEGHNPRAETDEGPAEGAVVMTAVGNA
ncbi:MAG: hypothetical protein ACRDJE_04580 [Dehalococcoidia bacterium]